MVGHWHIRGYGFWTVTSKDSGEVLGICGLWYPDGWPETELGWVMFEAAEGKGIAFEAAKAVRSPCLRSPLGFTTMTSNIVPGNTRSMRAGRTAVRRSNAPTKTSTWAPNTSTGTRHRKRWHDLRPIITGASLSLRPHRIDDLDLLRAFHRSPRAHDDGRARRPHSDVVQLCRRTRVVVARGTWAAGPSTRAARWPDASAPPAMTPPHGMTRPIWSTATWSPHDHALHRYPHRSGRTTARATLSARIPRIETDRLILRAATMADFPAWAHLLVPDDAGFLGGPHSEAEALEAFCVYVAGSLLHGHGLWSVTTKTDDAVLGVSSSSASMGDAEPELGWMMLPRARGAGLRHRSRPRRARLGLWAQAGLSTLVSYMHPENAASIALARRLGATTGCAQPAPGRRRTGLPSRGPRMTLISRHCTPTRCDPARAHIG